MAGYDWLSLQDKIGRPRRKLLRMASTTMQVSLLLIRDLFFCLCFWGNTYIVLFSGSVFHFCSYGRFPFCVCMGNTHVVFCFARMVFRSPLYEQYW